MREKRLKKRNVLATQHKTQNKLVANYQQEQYMNKTESTIDSLISQLKTTQNSKTKNETADKQQNLNILSNIID